MCLKWSDLSVAHVFATVLNSFCGFLRVILQFLFLFLVTKKNGVAINSLQYTLSVTAYNVLIIVFTGQKHEQWIRARVFTVADLKEEPEGAQAPLILDEKEEMKEGRKTGRASQTKPQRVCKWCEKINGSFNNYFCSVFNLKSLSFQSLGKAKSNASLKRSFSNFLFALRACTVRSK